VGTTQNEALKPRLVAVLTPLGPVAIGETGTEQAQRVRETRGTTDGSACGGRAAQGAGSET
jgi:hypothetical protein